MRRLSHILMGSIVGLTLLALSFGGVGVLAATDPASVGANASVPPAPAGFGLGVNFGNPSGWDNKGLATVSARAGANTARIKLPENHFATWGYDIEFGNGDMASYQANGLANMTGMLIGPTAAHSTSPTGGSLDQYSPKNLYQPVWSSPGVTNPNNYWASYVYQTVSRYKGQVKIWEVWNEPDLTSNWQLTQGAWWNSPPSPSDLPNWHDSIFAYIRLLRVTYEVAKAADPNCFVATGGIGYESFLDALLRYTDNPTDGSVTADYPARGGAWFDAVSYHHYPHYSTYDQANQSWIRGTDSDAMVTSFVARRNTLKIQLDRYGYNGTTYPQKLWLATESGVASKSVGGLAGSPELGRNYLLKLATLAQAAGVAQVDWFQLADTEADSAASNAYAHMGLYYDLRGKTVDTAQLKMAGTALKSWAASVRGQSYDAQSTSALELPSSARGYVFRGTDGRRSYALWAATSGNSEAASATIQLRTAVALEQRLWDYSATKATSTLTPSGGAVAVTLSSVPLFLIETASGGGAPTSTPVPGATSTPTAAPTSPPTAMPTATPTPAGGGSPPGGEKIANGGFENGLANWYIPSWFAAVASADGSQTHSGGKALRFQGSTSGPYIYEEVPASPGEQVSFSGWINVPQLNGTMSMVVDLVPRHQYNGDLSVKTLATITSTTGGWVRISGSAVMPDRTASVRLRVRFPRLDGTAYLDDLSLQSGTGAGNTATPVPSPTAPAVTPSPTTTAQPTATALPTATSTPTAQPTSTPAATPSPTVLPGGQLLLNGGYESGLDGWYIPSWFASTASSVSTDVHSGSKALQFKGNASGPYLYQEMPASPGQKVDFSGWINVPERNSGFSMVVELVARTSSNGVLATFPIAVPPSTTSGWVPLSGSAVMPDRTAVLRVQIRFPKLNGTVRFDDLSLQGQ